jgi:hypothetical protein
MLSWLLWVPPSHPPSLQTPSLQIQEAYDTLSDPAKRREYDSTDEFDDTLPLDCKPADFFKVKTCGGQSFVSLLFGCAFSWAYVRCLYFRTCMVFCDTCAGHRLGSFLYDDSNTVTVTWSGST